ncbi:hypothetical protein GCM10012286_48080 [Streptomyces lasiicapitis]|uniref:Uncharacterized protein n=1 Tax=Streptomyces lasiicapitis TaxID=1923961 RepID=A0ABQ2MDB3_9ACTN|nr:hypothetical protein GCM10012286_48080 [Streptomyces lasiicapitis]
MQTRDLEVGDHQLVLQGAADAHLSAKRELVVRRRAAVAVDRRGPRRAAGSHARARALLLRNVALALTLLRPGLLLLRHLLLGRLLLHLLLLRRLVVRRLMLRRCLMLRLLGLPGPAGRALLTGLAGSVLRRRVLRLRSRRGHGRRGGAGGATGEDQLRSVGRVAQVDGRSRADFHLVDPLPLHKRAVGGAVVLNDPTAAAPADRRVAPGDPGVVQRDVTLRITPKGVCPGRIKRPGPAIQFQYEFRHSMPH